MNPNAHPRHIVALSNPYQLNRARLLWLILIVASLLLLTQLYLGRRARAAEAPSQDKFSRTRMSEHVNVRASGGRSTSAVSLKDGHAVVAAYTGDPALAHALVQNEAQALALASADFDEDGVPDLVSGYANNGVGILTTHRGNVDAIYANAPEAQQRRARGEATDAPFLAARVDGLPVAPDFLGAGDFDADGHWDVVVARRGDNALYVLPGNGAQGFAAAKQLPLSGAVTALTTGEVNRPDGLVDIVVGIAAAGGAKVLVFEGPDGALRATPEEFAMPAPVTALALGQLDDHYATDLAVAAGHELLIVGGRDRRLSDRKENQVQVRPASIQGRSFATAITSLAIGDFADQHRAEIALLSEDGAVQILSRNDAKEQTGKDLRPLAAWQSDNASAERWPQATSLISAKVSTRPGADLVVVDAANRQLHIRPGANSEADDSTAWRLLMADKAQSEWMALDVENGPVAVLPMQLNADALNDLVLVNAGSAAPTVVLSGNSNEAAVREPAAEVGPEPVEHDYWTGATPTGATTPQATKMKARRTQTTQPEKSIKSTAKRSDNFAPLAGCPATPINIGQIVNGSLSVTDCFLQDGNYVDTYQFSGSAGQQVAVSMTAGNFDSYLYLISPDQTLLAVDDDSGGGTNARIPTEGGFISLPASGVYTIYATSFGPAELGGYSLLVSVPTVTCPSTRLVSGQVFNGALLSGDCFYNTGPRAGSFADVYTFVGSLGQTAAMAMASTSFDSYLYLLAPDGTLIAENDDSDITTNDARIPAGSGSIFLPANGVYTLIATSYFPQQIGSYQIAVVLGAGSAIVTNTNDSGIGSLRQAILNANANPGLDTISFNIGSGAQSIAVFSALPTITDAVVIDGTTQPGYAGFPIIEINGQFTPRGTPGLQITAGNSRVRGLVINRFGAADCSVDFTTNVSPGTGIILTNNGNNIVEGNYIGTDISGTAVRCNSGNGVYVLNSINNTVGGTTASARNVISGNRLPGVAMGGTFSISNRAYGNFIGTDATGNFDLGNRSNGVAVVDGTSNSIGGTVAGAGNVISGNDSPGVAIGFSDPIGILVQGNYIGTNAAGNSAMGNLGGVIIGGFFQLNGTPITATDNTVGGTTPAARNVISGNNGNGVEVINLGSMNNNVQGNFVGLNAGGTGKIGNQASGVFITNAPNNLIGGTVAGAGNYISGNTQYGVGVGIRKDNAANVNQFIVGGEQMSVLGNVIGSDPTQTLRIGNQLDGVYVNADSVSNFILGNVIPFNSGSGVRIPNNLNSGVPNSFPGRSIDIENNFIYANSVLGIDLGDIGVTPNDVGDIDGGANLQQNFPTLSSTTLAAPGRADAKDNIGTTAAYTIRGRLMSTPNRTYTVAWVFNDDAQCSGNNQPVNRPLLPPGRVPSVPTDGSGNGDFNFPLALPNGVARGAIYTTATDSTNNTSEYGPCLIVPAPAGGSSNRKTAGVFRPSNGIVYLKNSNTGGFADLSLIYGIAGDQPIAGDWDGNGTDTLGIYRNGTFFLRNSNTTGPADIVFSFGAPGDQPVAGDWDGNGTVTIGVYRPTTGVFFLRNSNSTGAPDVSFVLGNPGDVAIAGDWNGDGVTTTGVFRPTNGIIYLKNTNVSGNADIGLVYGNAGDKPLAGDWDGDGVDSVGIYRGGLFYLRNSNTQGFADLVFALGNPGDVPIAGDWDGLP